jgi:diguanylate cyclase (GGDEF)-like protein
VLEELGKESQIGVPILYQGAMWGELWAAGTAGRRFGAGDVRLLSAIATQASIVIGRAELFSEVARFAYEDPLTGLANRRRVDETLAKIDDDGAAATLLIGDVDGLKQVNDRFGHPAGDDLLRAVAGALSDAASAFGALLVARLGGDEFCVILPGDTLSDAEGFVLHAGRSIAQDLGPQVSLCWGAAARAGALGGARQLMIAADYALLNAKGLGSGRMWLHQSALQERAPDLEERRGWPPARRGVVDNDVISRVVKVLDQVHPHTIAAALEIVAAECCRILHAAAWTIWATTPDRDGLRTIRGVDSRLDARCGIRVISPTEHVVRPWVEFPTAASAIRTGNAFVASVNCGHADAAEGELLHRLGYRTVLGVGVSGRDVGYLMRVYFDAQHTDVGAAAPVIRVLAHHCAHRYCASTTSLRSPD